MSNSSCKNHTCGKDVARVASESDAAAPVTLPTSNETIPPAVDIIETDKEFIIVADMPGAEPETVEVSCDNGELTIFGAVADEEDNDEEVTCLCCQCEPGDYARNFQIGESIDADGITADFVDGVLTVKLPKRAEVQPKKIAVSKK